jgi:hypothetical protein
LVTIATTAMKAMMIAVMEPGPKQDLWVVDVENKVGKSSASFGS